jgi:hypothetical protein
MTAPIPLVGDLALSAVQRIDHALGAGFESVGVPGLDGAVLQRAGRGPHTLVVQGVLTGDTALDDLASLQQLAAAGEEVPFSADITTALELERVVVVGLRARVVAGTHDLVGYEISLVESPPLPPPAAVGAFGGLDDFGLGDLGFDTGLLDDIAGDISGLADDLAGAVDAAMAAVDQLSALAALGSLDVSGPLQPMSDAVGTVGAASATYADVAANLAALFGGDA